MTWCAGEVCKMDFFRFCAFRVPDMKNMEDIVNCMSLHLDDLCPPCKEMVQNATASLAGFHAACDASLTAQVCAFGFCWLCEPYVCVRVCVYVLVCTPPRGDKSPFNMHCHLTLSRAYSAPKPLVRPRPRENAS